MAKNAFERASRTDSTWKREGLPGPAALSERGIRTKESLAWMAARAPELPAPALRIDNPALRLEAAMETQDAHRERINALRQSFLQRGRKTREDFETAHGTRAKDRER